MTIIIYIKIKYQLYTMSTQTYSQKYYDENKDSVKKYLREKTQCECGSIVSRVNMSKHRKTKLHQNKLRHNEYVLQNTIET